MIVTAFIPTHSDMLSPGLNCPKPNFTCPDRWAMLDIEPCLGFEVTATFARGTTTYDQFPALKLFQFSSICDF